MATDGQRIRAQGLKTGILGLGIINVVNVQFLIDRVPSCHSFDFFGLSLQSGGHRLI
jgi:hypothetical protein